MSRLSAALVGALLILCAFAGSAASAPGRPTLSSRSSRSGAAAAPAPPVGTHDGRRVAARGARQESITANPLVGRRKQPNIVVIMADDARNDDLRFMPNVRHLIGDKGVRFVNTFSPQPLCCPARASVDTGQYSHNHHVWSHVSPYGFRALRDKETLPVWLHRAGYDTTFLGKYLNGYGEQRLRNGKSSLRYVPPGWTDWEGSVDGGVKASPQLDGGTYRYYDTTVNMNGTLVPHRGTYQTYLYSHLAQLMFRREARSPRPFFSWLSFVAPHHGLPHESDDPPPMVRSDGKRETFGNPARPPDVWGRFDDMVKRAPGYHGEKDVSDKPFFIRDNPPLSEAEQQAVLEDTRQRAEALSVLDDEVAHLMAVLRRTGELKHTYVVFTSDNGYFLGEHRMRQGKILPYEPSLRVPLLIRGPGIPAGQVRTDPFLMTDFAPTFLQAAGAPIPAMVDGVGMLGVAQHGDRGWTRGILTETGPRAVGSDVAESDNFLVAKGGPSPLRFSQGVRTGRYLYVEHASRERELYDLKSDPREVTNLVDRPGMRRVRRALAHELDVLRNCVGRACAKPLPPLLRTTHPVLPPPDGTPD
ncbi:MAG: sulfatase family protein [Nocardioidaceae bacterium]